MNLLDNKKKNIACLIIGIIGMIALPAVTNFAGLHVGALSDKVQHWNETNNPFVILVALGLFNLVRKKEFTSKIINSLASVSLYVYIIHENIIIRTYLRPAIWTEIYNQIGHDYLYVVILCMSLALFIASTVLGLIYSKTIQRIVNDAIEKAYNPARKLIIRIEDRLMRVKSECSRRD